VTVGIVGDVTGPLSSAAGGAVQGAKAAFDAQNAQGGVNGRKIVVVTQDTQSNPNNALQAAQSLVQQSHVFAVLDGPSAFFSAMYPYFHQNNVPIVTGFPDDPGAEWGNQANTDLVDGTGSIPQSPPTSAWTWYVKLLQSANCKSVATLGYGAVGASAQSATGAGKAAAAAGIPNVDNDISLTLTQTDYTSTALRIKSSGADCWAAFIAPVGVQAILTSLHQEGAHARPVQVSAGYGPDFVKAPLSSISQGLITSYFYVTSDRDPSVGSQVANAMTQYTGYTGPSNGWSLPAGAIYGYTGALLLIKGLEAAGSNLTTTSFLSALHSQAAWTANGLQNRVDLAVSKQGTYPPSSAGGCAYAEVVKGNAYVPYSGNAYCTPLS
jgi:branched-chain amino acid transport system substrate-binding protein